jgi:hypothetical protein
MATKRPHSDRAIQDYQATLIKYLEEALNGIRFGSVEVVVHEGRVVQIERKEKLASYGNGPAEN